MRSVMKVAAVAMAGALALAACGSSSSGGGSSAGGTPSSSKPPVKVGMAYDIGGRGDKSFNDAAAAGLDKAAKRARRHDQGAVRGRRARPTPRRPQRLELLAAGGYNPIIAVGFAYAARGQGRRAEVPEHQLRDRRRLDASRPPNVANLVFAEKQGSFLVGVLAAQGVQDRQGRLHRWRQRRR